MQHTLHRLELQVWAIQNTKEIGTHTRAMRPVIPPSSLCLVDYLTVRDVALTSTYSRTPFCHVRVRCRPKERLLEAASTLSSAPDNASVSKHYNVSNKRSSDTDDVSS